MPVDTPATSLVAEVRDDQPWCLEGPITVVERDPDPCVSEPDNIRPSVAGQVGEEARVPFDPPAAGHIAECGNHEVGGLEGPVAVIEGTPDPCVSEPDNIRGCRSTRQPPAS
jgi:hypothetical protein